MVAELDNTDYQPKVPVSLVVSLQSSSDTWKDCGVAQLILKEPIEIVSNSK